MGFQTPLVVCTVYDLIYAEKGAKAQYNTIKYSMKYSMFSDETWQMGEKYIKVREAVFFTH